MVLYLYEFTLLSNLIRIAAILHFVLYLYEFTLLSNAVASSELIDCVLYLYEFTLLSNEIDEEEVNGQSYTSMNLHYSQTMT